MFVLDLFFSAAYTNYLYSYSQHGSIYSGLYSCSLEYVREFSLLKLHWFQLNLIIFKVDVTFLGGGICCFVPCWLLFLCWVVFYLFINL